MQLTTILSVLITCAGTATAAIAGIEPMFYRLGAMQKRSTGDHDPAGGKNIYIHKPVRHYCPSSTY